MKLLLAMRNDKSASAIALISLLYVVALLGLQNGYLFNDYPYISDDGYDWLHEGYALLAVLSGRSIEPLPVLRPPVFVLVTALDALLGGSGYVIFPVYGAALGLGMWVMVRFGDWLGIPRNICFPLSLVFALAPVNYFRAWLLADFVCIAIMLWSAYLVLRWAESGDQPSRLLRRAAALALAAGLTQTYGMIPFFGIAGIVLSVDWHRRRRIHWPLLLACLGIALGWVVLTWLWRLLMPHTSTPSNFSLFRISLAMWPFYGHVWPYVLGPLLPLLLAVLWPVGRWQWELRYAPLGLWVTAAAFALLSLLYQWPDTRFTMIWFGLFLLALLATMAGRLGIAGESTRHLRRIRRWAWISLALVIIQSQGLVPQSYWSMTIDSLRWGPYRTWLAEFLRATPVDRFNLAVTCGSKETLCEAVEPPAWASPYAAQIIRAQQKLAKAQ